MRSSSPSGPHHQQLRRIARAAGRSAIRSGGRSKSKSETRIGLNCSRYGRRSRILTQAMRRRPALRQEVFRPNDSRAAPTRPWQRAAHSHRMAFERPSPIFARLEQAAAWRLDVPIGNVFDRQSIHIWSAVSKRPGADLAIVVRHVLRLVSTSVYLPLASIFTVSMAITSIDPSRTSKLTLPSPPLQLTHSVASAGSAQAMQNLRQRRGAVSCHLASAATCILAILSGSRTGSPRLMVSTMSMPDGHLAPHRILPVEEAGIAEADEELAVGRIRALRARHGAGAAHMRLLGELLLRFGFLEPPVPVPVGSPPCAMKPSMTRWNTTLS